MSNTDGTPREDWEYEMSREFDNRVRDLNEAPLTFDHVRGKAMAIRRARRLAVAGGVLAAAAVIVPVAVFATGQGAGGDPDQDLIATSSPSATPTQAEDDGNPVLPPGGIGVAYIEGRTLHRPDGATFALPDSYDGGTLLGDAFYGVRNVDGSVFLDIVVGDGTVTETIETASGIAVNTDGTAVAYLERDGDLMTRWAEGQVEIPSDLGRDITLAAFVGGPDCNVGADFCRVFANHGDLETSPEEVTSDATVNVNIPDALRINDADETGLFTVLNKSRMAGSCGGLYDEVSADYVWETCDFQVLDLSPDSLHVSGTDDYGDGLGAPYASILDAASGEEVVRFDPEDGFVREMVWENDEHLLALVYDPSGWGIYRIGVDGSTDRVVGPSTEGDDITPAYKFVSGG